VGLFEFRAEFHGAVGGGRALAIEKFKLAFFGRGEEDLVRFDLNVKTEFLEFCGKPVGVVLVVGRADVVRAGGETLHVRTHVLRAGNGAQLFFPTGVRRERIRRSSSRRAGTHPPRRANESQERR